MRKNGKEEAVAHSEGPSSLTGYPVRTGVAADWVSTRTGFAAFPQSGFSRQGPEGRGLRTCPCS